MEYVEITLDTEVLGGLRALQVPGQPSLLLRVLDLFEASSTRLIAELEQHLASGDIEGITRSAHTLKSSSANIGATQLAAQAKAVEMCGRAQDLAGCRAAAESLQGLFEGTLIAVAALHVQEAG
jgi:two-component system sensor histidine kinase BarA